MSPAGACLSTTTSSTSCRRARARLYWHAQPRACRGYLIVDARQPMRLRACLREGGMSSRSGLEHMLCMRSRQKHAGALVVTSAGFACC